MAEYAGIELLHDFKRGEARAFKEIHHAYSNQLVVFASKFIENRAVAEEIVSDAFLKLFKVHQNFADLPGIRGFLYLVTRRDCLNHLRHLRYLRSQKSKLVADLVTENALEINQIEGDLLKAFYTAVERLPDKSGMIIKLFLEGRNTGEIAELLRISPLTVRSQKRYAINLLKASLLDKRMPRGS